MPTVLFFVVSAFPAHTFTLESIDGHAGLLWRGTYAGAGDLIETAPSPLLNTIGVSVPFRLGGYFLFAPELRFTGIWYGLTSDGSRSVPVEVEYADSVWVLHVAVEPALWFDLPLTETLSAGAYVGPVFLLSIPTVTWGSGATQLDQIIGYLYRSGRFFLMETGLTFTWATYENLRLHARLETHLPVFHIWDGESLPFYDQLTVAFTVGLRVMLDLTQTP